MVEGDYALSSNNCQTDEILAAQSVVACGRGGQGSWGGKCSEPCGGGVLRAAEGCRGLPEAGFSVRTFFLSFQKHKGGGKHVGCGFTYAPAFK